MKLPQRFVEQVEKFGLATFSKPEVWKVLARPTFSTIFVIDKTCSEIRGASKPSEAIVPELIEILKTIGLTNSFHAFGYQFHGNSNVFGKGALQNCCFPVSLKHMPPKHVNHQ